MLLQQAQSDQFGLIAQRIRIPNLSSEPLTLRRNEHVCHATLTFQPETKTDNVKGKPPPHVNRPDVLHSAPAQIDPDNQLSQDIQAQFKSLKEFDSVFDPDFKGYNGAAGPFQAKVNMGPVEPPQRKGRLPQYDWGKLVVLQEKFDELEALSVFETPEKANSQPILPRHKGEWWSSSSHSLRRCWPLQQTAAFPSSRRRHHSVTHCPVETLYQDRPNECLLPDTPGERVLEVLWCCHPV